VTVEGDTVIDVGLALYAFSVAELVPPPGPGSETLMEFSPGWIAVKLRLDIPIRSSDAT